MVQRLEHSVKTLERTINEIRLTVIWVWFHEKNVHKRNVIFTDFINHLKTNKQNECIGNVGEPKQSPYDDYDRMPNDNVRKPAHYTKGEIECIDAMRSAMTKDAFSVI